MALNLAMNRRAARLVEEMISKAEKLRVDVHELPCGSIVVDCGVEAEGSLSAGLYAARICVGDLAEFSISTVDYDGLALPVINVWTDYPVITSLGAQLGDWEVDVGGYHAIGSGPARALALDRPLPRAVAVNRAVHEERGYRILSPRQVYEEIGYSETADVAVIVLESSELPSDEVMTDIAGKCGVDPSDLYALVTPTTSLVGSVQIAGRVVEVGIHKLMLLGFDLKSIRFGSGCSPIAPPHPDMAEAMGRVNDMIRYAGTTFYAVDVDEEYEPHLRELLARVPTAGSENYGKTFMEIFREAGCEFYGVDLGEFSPAVITVTNLRSGRVFTEGRVDADMVRRVLGV